MCGYIASDANTTFRFLSSQNICWVYGFCRYIFCQQYIYGDKIRIIAWHWLNIKSSTSIKWTSMFCFKFFFLDDLEVFTYRHTRSRHNRFHGKKYMYNRRSRLASRRILYTKEGRRRTKNGIS